jgi:hypothetical protein
MRWLNKLNKPWLHFIVLGVIFYQCQSILLPEPKTIIGPLSEVRINNLRQQWQTNTGQNPSPLQEARLIEEEINGDILLQRALALELHRHDNFIYQRLIRNMNFLQLAAGKTDAELFKQALEMRLHLDDTVVKQRLIQVMEQQLLATNPPPLPSAEAIKAEFNKRFVELRKPPLYSIEHIFFNHEREHEAAAIIARITAEKLDFETAKQLSSPYLQGYKYSDQTPNQLARNFGIGFVVELQHNVQIIQGTLPQWLGPLRSIYGLHYVWLNAVEPARDAQLFEVEEQLRNDLEYAAQAQALKNAITMLRKEYDVRMTNRKIVKVGQ